ncbi:MAG TPA: hypothetical protein O0X39_02765 [Methanocorpusculum sp.]|nr:hypothetical protein [Methanocorpusculum sp.]
MMEKSGDCTASDFHHELYRRFDEAKTGYLTITAGELHKSLHASNRISAASNALYEMQNIGDVIVTVPSGGAGASLEIRFALPREKGLNLEKSIYTEKEVLAAKEKTVKILLDAAGKHPVLRGLSDLVRQKKSEKAARSLCTIIENAAAVIAKHQHIRADAQKPGVICGAIGRAGILSDEAQYALDFVRICGNSAARRIPDEYLLTPKVFAFEAHAAAVFLNEAIEKGILWKKEKNQ